MSWLTKKASEVAEKASAATQQAKSKSKIIKLQMNEKLNKNSKSFKNSLSDLTKKASKVAQSTKEKAVDAAKQAKDKSKSITQQINTKVKKIKLSSSNSQQDTGKDNDYKSNNDKVQEFLHWTSRNEITCSNGNIFLEIIYPVLFEYIDSITIRNVIQSTDGFNFMPKCLMNRYWNKNERVWRLNKYKIVEKNIKDFEYELIRINITSPQQFLSYYWENESFQQNLECKVLSYYIALKNEYYKWDLDEIEYEQLNLKVITIDFWDVMSWYNKNFDKKMVNENMHYFKIYKPEIECVLWNEMKFEDLNDIQRLNEWRRRMPNVGGVRFGFRERDVFRNLKDTLILPNLLNGGNLVKEWYCSDCYVCNENGKSWFNQVFGCIDETNVSINGWDRAGATWHDNTRDCGILLKYVTFMMWKGVREKEKGCGYQ